MAVLAVALLVAFCIVETKVEEPIIPLDLFKIRTFSVASAVGFVIGFTMFGAIVYLPLYLQVVHGSSPTASGLELLPLMAGLLIDVHRQRATRVEDRQVQDLPDHRHGR